MNTITSVVYDYTVHTIKNYLIVADKREAPRSVWLKNAVALSALFLPLFLSSERGEDGLSSRLTWILLPRTRTARSD